MRQLGRRFLVVWAGQTISTVGSTMTGVGVAVWVFVETGSLLWLGVLAAVQALPAVAATAALRRADRLDRRRLMILADSLAGLATAGALAVALVGDITPWHLAVAGLVGGLGTAIQVAAYQAAVPHLVDDSVVDRANGLVQLAPAAGIVLGPALATPIVATWGIVALLVVDLATFAVGLVATSATGFDARPAPGDTVHAATDDGSLRSAVRWLRAQGRPLLALLVVMAVVNACLSFFNVGFLALAVESAGAARSGLPLTVGGMSMVVASLAVGAAGLPTRRVRLILGALWVIAGGCLAAAMLDSLAVLFVVAATSLATVPVVTSAVTTLFHEHVPPDMHVRVFGLRHAVAQALSPAATAMAGVVGARVAAPLLDGSTPAGEVLAAVVGGHDGREGAALLLVAAGGLVAVAVVAATRAGLGDLDAVASGPRVVTPERVTAA